MKFNSFNGYKKDDFLKNSLQDRFNKAWGMIIGQHPEKNFEQRLGIADYLTVGIPFLLIELTGLLLHKLKLLYGNKPEDKPESKLEKMLRKANRLLYHLCCIGLIIISIAAFIAKMCAAFVFTFIAIIFIPFIHGIVQLYNKYNKLNTDSVPEHSTLVTNPNSQSPFFSLSIGEAAKKNEESAIKSTFTAPGRVSQLGQFAQADATQQKPAADFQLRLQPTQ